MSEEIYSCEDCKNSRVGWWRRLKSILGIRDLEPEDYSCHMVVRIHRTKFDSVLGYTGTKIDLDTCSNARFSKRLCGKNARYWVPRHKKDLFKKLKKDYVPPADD